MTALHKPYTTGRQKITLVSGDNAASSVGNRNPVARSTVKRCANGFVANFGIVLETACETFVSQLGVTIRCAFGYRSQRSRTEPSSLGLAGFGFGQPPKPKSKPKPPKPKRNPRNQGETPETKAKPPKPTRNPRNQRETPETHAKPPKLT